MTIKPLLVALFVAGAAVGPAGAACDLASADASAGEKRFALCKACHTVAEKTNRVGPHIDGILDQPAARIADFAYSDAMRAFAAAGGKWDVATLDAYIKKPKEVVPKGKMAFAGMAKDQDRCNLLKFLSTKPALP